MFSIEVIGTKSGTVIGKSPLADRHTYDFYDWLIKSQRAPNPNYTVYFLPNNNAIDAYFELKSVSISTTTGTKITVKITHAHYIDKKRNVTTIDV